MAGSIHNEIPPFLQVRATSERVEPRENLVTELCVRNSKLDPGTDLTVSLSIQDHEQAIVTVADVQDGSQRLPRSKRLSNRFAGFDEINVPECLTNLMNERDRSYQSFIIGF